MDKHSEYTEKCLKAIEKGFEAISPSLTPNQRVECSFYFKKLLRKLNESLNINTVESSHEGDQKPNE